MRPVVAWNNRASILSFLFLNKEKPGLSPGFSFALLGANCGKSYLLLHIILAFRFVAIASNVRPSFSAIARFMRLIP